MDNIAVVTWPPGRRSLMAQMLEICLGNKWTNLVSAGLALNTPETGVAPKLIPHTALPQSEDRHYLVEYEDFPLSTVMRYEGFATKAGEDSYQSFTRFASEDYGRYEVFATRWIASNYAQNQLLVDAAELRANTKPWLNWALSVIAPGSIIRDEDMTTALKLAADWPATTKLPNLEKFRYYNGALFKQLAQVRMKRGLALQVATEANASLDDDTILRLQTYGSQEEAALSLVPASEGDLHSAKMLNAEPVTAETAPGAPLSLNQIGLAYQLLFDRKASPAEIEQIVLRRHSVKSLSDAFLNSAEFSAKYEARQAKLRKATPPVVIHVHIPKTAGTSLNAILATGLRQDTIMQLHESDMGELLAKALPERRKLRLLRGHMLHGVANYMPQSSLYVTVLRKPGPRIYSFYQYVTRTELHPLHEMVVAKKMSFGAFLEFATTRNDLLFELENGQIRRLAGAAKTAEEAAYLPVFRRALRNIFAPDMVFGLTEQFGLFIQQLAEMGIIKSSKDYQLNVSPPGSSYEDAIAELTEREQQIFSNFTCWDNKFYDVCENYVLGIQASQDLKK